MTSNKIYRGCGIAFEDGTWKMEDASYQSIIWLSLANSQPFLERPRRR